MLPSLPDPAFAYPVLPLCTTESFSVQIDFSIHALTTCSIHAVATQASGSGLSVPYTSTTNNLYI